MKKWRLRFKAGGDISIGFLISLPEAYVFINPRTGWHFNKNTLSNEWSRIRTALGLDKSLKSQNNFIN